MSRFSSQATSYATKGPLHFITDIFVNGVLNFVNIDNVIIFVILIISQDIEFSDYINLIFNNDRQYYNIRIGTVNNISTFVFIIYSPNILHNFLFSLSVFIIV